MYGVAYAEKCWSRLDPETVESLTIGAANWVKVGP